MQKKKNTEGRKTAVFLKESTHTRRGGENDRNNILKKKSKYRPYDNYKANLLFKEISYWLENMFVEFQLWHFIRRLLHTVRAIELLYW